MIQRLRRRVFFDDLIRAQVSSFSNWGKAASPEKLKHEAAVAACVETNQCVGCTRQFFTKSFLGDDAACWLRRAVRKRHRHAIEQASRRWRGDTTVQHERAIKF